MKTDTVCADAKAAAELRRLRMIKTEGTLSVLTRTPKFTGRADKYVADIKAGGGSQKNGTIEIVESHL